MAKKPSKASKAVKAVKPAKVVKAPKKAAKEELDMSFFDCEDEFCDFDHFDEVVDDEMALDFFDQFSRVAETQAELALDLTKLIVEHDKGNLDAEAILSLYRRALETVSDSSPMKSMMDEYLAK